MNRWLLFTGVVWLSGCELVAGIKDIELTDSDGSPVTDGAPTDAPQNDAQPNDAQPPNDVAVDSADGGIATELIDDMEANTGLISTMGGRSGAWFTYNDATSSGSQTPTAGGKFLPSMITPPRGSSNYAARTNGNGFTIWGAGMGFNVNDPASGPNQGIRSIYDASAYTGFVFYARIGAGDAGPTSAVRFNVPNKDTDAAGGVCTPVSQCSDYFGVNLTLTTTWTMYVIHFTDLKQLGFGQSIPSFDPKTIYGCEFKVDANTTFDVWIDDIAFLLP